MSLMVVRVLSAALASLALSEYDGTRDAENGGPEFAAIADDLATLPFLAERRVVIIPDADRFISANRERFEVSTFGELAGELDRAQTGTSRELPDLGFVHPFARKVVQAVNSMYWI